MSNHPRPPPSTKEIYNPFTKVSPGSCNDHQTVTSSTISKRAWKCFQLLLICQKLIKPFSSSGEIVMADIRKPTKSKSTQEINHSMRKLEQNLATRMGSDPNINQNILEYDDNHSQSSDEFPYDINESVTAPYWDLDIDSAIVGDYNSMSAISVDEQIDPHYTTINLAGDERYVNVPHLAMESSLYKTIFPIERSGCSNSNTSSPTSGVYSKIIKPKKNGDFDFLIEEYYRLQNGARLNFDKIMDIRTNLRSSTHQDDGYHRSRYSVTTSDRSYRSNTPDIPQRNYGSNVINYITKLRQNCAYQHPVDGRMIADSDKELSTNHVYSQIWQTEHNQHYRHCKTPTSEPVASKRSINRILRHLNSTHLSDSIDEPVSLSFNSYCKKKYFYPRHFSDNISKQSYNTSNVNVLTDEMDRFRHMDSELDINLSFSKRDKKVELQLYNRGKSDSATKMQVPCAAISRDAHFPRDDSMFLQPLMERSFEEDYFSRDMLASLECIDV